MRNNESPTSSTMDLTDPNAPIGMERNRFFTGKYMTARDFQADPDYFLSRHRLHNRLLHGWGVVYGLNVKRHPDPTCDHRWVVIEPGIALDCFGRELILSEQKTVDLCAKETDHDCTDSTNRATSTSEKSEGRRLICLQYHETPMDYVPVLYGEGQGDPTEKEANRTREGARIVVLPWREVDDWCWPLRPVLDKGPKEYLRDDCDAPILDPLGIGTKGERPRQGLVPLALVKSVDCSDPDSLPLIFTQGRRTVAIAPDNLTHILDVNWCHGGTIPLSHLRDPAGMGGTLVIYFDRKLLIPEPEAGTARGINKHTFVVQYGGIQRALEFLDGTVEFDNETAKATFQIKHDLLAQPQNIAYNTIYITLKCDFICDCHGRPVDGNFLGGYFPTGNGTPGGIFESWFEVVPDNNYGQGRM